MIKVTGVGRLVNDAKVFTYGGDKTGINFSIASNRMGSEEATFVSCTMFGRGENLAQHLKQGNQIIIHGDLATSENGGSYYTKIIVSEVEFGASKQ